MVAIGAALSTNPDPAEAAREAASRAVERLEGAPVSLAVAFHSPHHTARLAEAVGQVRAIIGEAPLLGCTAQAVIGEGREVEEGAAFSVWAASLPGAEVEPFALDVEQTPEGAAVTGLPLITHAVRAVLLIGDPFTFPMHLLEQLNTDHPGLPVIGGMASGGAGPAGHALILGDSVRSSGAVGALLLGDLAVETIVAQGCRPVGSPYVVTDAEANVIKGLGGQPPLERLREILARLPPEDQRLVQEGLHLGTVIDEYKTELGPGDFLIRNVLGADPESGAIAVGDFVRVGQTVQFHLRDAAAADLDLVTMLRQRGERMSGAAAGALMFTCNGRGRRLFGLPDHDVKSLERVLGPLPVAGMFCAGEIGPVAGRNFLHGFTASIALFLEQG